MPNTQSVFGPPVCCGLDSPAAATNSVRALPRASRDFCKLPRRWWCGGPQIACMASAACKRRGAQPAYSRACFAGAVRGRERAAAAHWCSLKQGVAVQQRHAALRTQEGALRVQLVVGAP